MEPEESVYQLVNSLCYNLLKDIDCESNCQATIKLCRMKAFEILLKKSATITTTTDNDFDVEKELEYCIYEMRIKAKCYTEKMKCKKFEKIVEEMLNDQDFQTSRIQATLEFLLHLRNTGQTLAFKEATIPPFQYQYPWSGWAHESITVLGSSLFCIPRDIDNILDHKHPIIKNNPYVSAYYRRSISYRGKPDYEKSMDSIFSSFTNVNSIKQKESMTSLSPRNELIRSNLVNGTSSCFMEAIKSVSNSTHNFIKLKQFQHKIDHTQIVPVVKNIKLNELHSVGSRYCWENLGNINIRHESLFSTENSNAFYHLLAVYNKKLNMENIEPKIVPLKVFMHDVKMLIVGIRSESFSYNDLYIFDIYPNLTINNLSIIALKNSIKEFLECGTCYKRLQILTSKNSENFKLIFDGFVFRALCSGVAKFLVLFRKIVLSCDDSSLLQLSSRIGRLRQQLITLSHILGVHPHIDYDKKIPTGSDFLCYLYKEIINVTQRDMIMLLIFILKECCHVYFNNFQKWIFYGHLDDPYKELFIYFIDHYRINTKYYFDKAFVIRKQSVPDFLQGFEEDILLCGKYTMLLRTFKPTHPIFSLAPPNITVCLSFQQIEKLKSECTEYTKRAQEICGPAVSVSVVYKEKAERHEAFLKMVKEREHENMELWREEQITLAAEVTEEKHRRLENLKLQIQNVKAQRLAERKANIQQEKLYLQHEMEIEDKRLEHEIQEREKRIQYYVELNKIVSDRKDRAEKELKRERQEELDILEGHQGAIESEFESCTENEEEDDDNTSIYEDIEKAPCESSVMAMSLGSECYITPDDGHSSMTSIDPTATHNENYIREQMDDPNTSYIGMKKSVSDYFNANVVDVELKRNKQKILGSDISDFFAIDNAQKQSSTENLTEAQKNKMKSLSHVTDYDNYNNENIKISVNNDSNLIKVPKRVQINDENLKSKDVLTDLQKNRQKVMKHEFGYNLPDELTKKKITDDCADEKELTDLQKIRNKVLSCEFNIKQKQEQNTQNQRSHLSLDFMSTDRARNRRKVLESEFNIITGERVGSEESLITTPMSTTSDDIGSGIVNLYNKNPEKCESPQSGADQRFANVTIRKQSKNNLKLDTLLARKVNADDDDSMPKRCGIPDTAILAKETPASGLNTAGVLHKQGFNFATDSNNHILTEIELKTDRNYLCKKFSYLQVNDLFYPKKSSTFFPFTSEDQGVNSSNTNSTNQEILNDLIKANLDDVKYIDGTILKRFIQMSIVIPLNTHMAILNNEILKMYLNDLDILKHFKSLRNYYFLMDGEYGSYICDGIIRTLESGIKPSNLLNFQALHSILDNALGSSIRGNDKNGERLSFIVEQIPEKFDLTSPDVLSVLSLSYKVTWPLNLILNNETLEQYSNIFRYLIKVRRISWLLDEAFQSLKDVVKKTNRLMLLSPQYRHVQLIRHKLLHFVSTLENHITSIALQGSWKKFKDDLLTTKSMEDLYRKHTVYIKRIRFLCMLNKRSIEFNKTIENIFIVILRFCRHLKSKRWHLINGDDLYQHGKYKQMITDELDYDKFIKYTIYLGKKIVKHGYQQEIGDFINLININNFYTTNEPSHVI